jgi:hypothetical protein
MAHNVLVQGSTAMSEKLSEHIEHIEWLVQHLAFNHKFQAQGDARLHSKER